jgi:hypothetical protein
VKVKDIAEWYRHEVQNPRAQHGAPRLVMGCPIWGGTYREWFLKYGLPSILARPNRKALDAAGWQLVIYVEDPEVWMAKVALAFPDVPLQARPLPEGFVKAVKKNGQLKFLMVAAVHNLLAIETGRYPDAGFHMLLPDHVYSGGYFANLLWLAWKHPAIIQTSLTSMAAELTPLLEPFRAGDNSLGIAAPLLGRLGWETMTKQWRSWSLDGNETLEQMPNTDFFFWRGSDHVRMHCAHQNLMWLSPNRCRHVTTELGGTMDSELPRYTRDYCFTPQLTDDMAFIALANGGPPAPVVDFAKFRQDFIANLGGNPAFEKYVRTPCYLPCEPADGFPGADALDLRSQQVLQKL